MKASIIALMAMASGFTHNGISIKHPSCAWKHSGQRLEKAKQKRLRKNAARCKSMAK